MALQGTLDTFALADLIQLLASTRKTGELMIQGDRGHGRLWFDDGAIVGGEPQRAGGAVEGLFELLRFGEGTFVFEADRAPDAAHDPADALRVLETAQERLATWAPVEALLPSSDVGLALSPELPADEVAIDRDRWRLLVAVGGGTTFAGFGRDLDLAEFDAGLTIKGLVDDGLVIVTDPTGDGLGFDAAPSVADVGFDPVVVDEVIDLDEPELAPEPEPVVEESVEAEVVDLPVVDEADRIDAIQFDTDLIDPPVALIETPADLFEPSAGPALDEPADLDLPTAVPADGGSLDVDLDHTLGGASDDHSYLASSADGSEALPEPLPSADWPGGEDRESDPARWDGDDDELARQLEALSPQAAAAVAAAANDGGADAANEEGRRVLRRIIHKS